MLVLANGAYKSGSAWLFRIVEMMTGFGAPPSEYLAEHWWHPSIAPDKLESFLRRVDFHAANFLVKTHFGSLEQRKLLLAHQDVVVLGMTRDLRDVVVSAYYHHRRNNNYKHCFYEFYWTKGRQIAERVRRYNAVWAPPAPNLYVTSYEKLLDSFTSEVRAMADLIGVSVDNEKIDHIRQKTDFTSWRQTRSDGHLRKGRAGDWQNHMSEDIVADMTHVEKSGLPPISLGMRMIIRLKRVRANLYHVLKVDKRGGEA